VSKSKKNIEYRLYKDLVDTKKQIKWWYFSMAAWRTLLLAKYKIEAKDFIKMEIEALADLMTDKDQYVIFTKTPKIEYDKDLHQPADAMNRLKGVVTGYSKKKLYTLDPEEIKKAKYAHLVKLTTKKIVRDTERIDDATALKMARKLKLPFVKTINDVQRYRHTGNDWNTIIWLENIVGYEPEKNLTILGIDAVGGYGSISFISPKAYKEEKTYLLEKKKEPKADMTLTAEEKKLIEDYVPDLGDHTSFRNPMPIDKIKTQASKMSDDDLAWHLLTSKKALALGDEDFVRERFGFREICVLQLMNKNITKKERTEIAEYMLDKMGVSFVGGPTLKQYIVALTKSGAIDKKMLQGGQDDEMQSDIYYGKITDPDELRKLDYKKWGYQLSHNPHTPSDVLEKVLEYNKKTGTNDEWSNGEIKWSGMNPAGGGKIGEDTSIYFTEAVEHPNFPLDKLLALFDKYKAKYKANPVALNGLIRTLWKRSDLPKDIAHELVEHEKKFNKKYISSTPPACFDEKEALAYWKSLPKDRKEAFVDHPNAPSEVLWEALNDKDTYHRNRHEAYKKLREKGDITDKDVITKAKKELKFDAPDELLKEFGLQAYLGTKGEQKLKFSKVSDEDLNKLKAEMKSATTHDDFTFEVVAAYNIDKQVHKDFAKKAKEIGNIKHGLYHGTSMSNAAGILATGINTKGDSRTGAMFGNGFYLASSASKAAQYASDDFSKSGYGVVFKMDVALGKAAEWKYGRPERDDFMRNHDEKTQKALKDYAEKEGFERTYEVPRWHLTHDSVHAKKGLALLHDEYVVKAGSQIDIKEIIIVHKEEK
jgi:hypothetical protein